MSPGSVVAPCLQLFDLAVEESIPFVRVSRKRSSSRLMRSVMYARRSTSSGYASAISSITLSATPWRGRVLAELSVAGAASPDPPEHVAAPGVARQHPVPDQEGQRARVVRGDPQGDVGLVARAGHDVCELRRALDERRERVALPGRTLALEHRRPSRRRCRSTASAMASASVRVPVELHEDQVPDLHEAPVSLDGSSSGCSASSPQS